MSPVDDLVAFARLFGLLERNAVCCGTVSVAQCVALQTLTEGAWTNASLAEQLGVTPGAVSRLLDGLEAQGWVERRRSPDDRRQVAPHLTPTGRAEAKRLHDLTAATLAVVLDKVPGAQRKSVEAAIHLLRVAAEQTRSEWPMN